MKERASCSDVIIGIGRIAVIRRYGVIRICELRVLRFSWRGSREECRGTDGLVGDGGGTKEVDK